MRFISNVNGAHACTSIRLVIDRDTGNYQLHFDVRGNESEGGMIEGTLDEITKLGTLLAKFRAKDDFISFNTPFKDET